MKTMKKYLILFALAVFAVAISGCYGGRPIHVLNMKTYPSNGFVNADSLPRRADVKYPKEFVILNELPGSGANTRTRIFTVSPLRLMKLGSITSAGRVGGITYDQRMENNKFILEIKNADMVPGLPPELAPDTIATLRYVGTYVDSFSTWDSDSVDTRVNTLRLVVTARGCRQANGSVLNPDWICSDIVSKSITKVQDGQRIPRVP